MLVYKVTNKLDGKVYIGQTKRPIEERWKEHCKPALQSRSYLSAAIQKHGKDNFLIEILQKVDSQEDLDKLEDKLIEEYKAMAPGGYNLRHGGNGGRHSEEAREKISKANVGRKASKETLEKLRLASTGKTPTNCRPVIGTNIVTGEIIRLESPMAMPERFHYNCVHRCAKGEKGRKQHRGFTWKYE